jgi:hypothetical protein
MPGYGIDNEVDFEAVAPTSRTSSAAAAAAAAAPTRERRWFLRQALSSRVYQSCTNILAVCIVY